MGFLVFGLVYGRGGGGGRVVGPPMAVSCTSLACDWDLIIVKLTVLIAQGDEAGCVSTRVGWSISIPLSRRRRKQCRECRECSPIRKVPTEVPVESFQKGLHSLHRLHQ